MIRPPIFDSVKNSMQRTYSCNRTKIFMQINITGGVLKVSGSIGTGEHIPICEISESCFKTIDVYPGMRLLFDLVLDEKNPDASCTLTVDQERYPQEFFTFQEDQMPCQYQGS